MTKEENKAKGFCRLDVRTLARLKYKPRTEEQKQEAFNKLNSEKGYNALLYKLGFKR